MQYLYLKIYVRCSFVHNPTDATTSKVNLYIYNYLQFGIYSLGCRSRCFMNIYYYRCMSYDKENSSITRQRVSCSNSNTYTNIVPDTVH